MTVHYHYMNGSSGCLPDSSDIYARKRDAIEWAETLFGDGQLCDPCFDSMSGALRSRGKDITQWIFYFDRNCEVEVPNGGSCSSGADYVEITKEVGTLKEDKETLEWKCPC